MHGSRYTFTFTHVIAAILWSVALNLLVITFLIPDDRMAIRVGTAALGICAAAGTVSVRGFFLCWDHHVRNAFELGRDAGRNDLRSVD